MAGSEQVSALAAHKVDPKGKYRIEHVRLNLNDREQLSTDVRTCHIHVLITGFIHFSISRGLKSVHT